jgi:hypothetical protein
MPMPKNSSKSKPKTKDWVSGNDLVHENSQKKLWAGTAFVVVLLCLAVFLFWKPKALVIENVVPTGAVAFVRLNDVQEHLTRLRGSKFWQSFSTVDVPKLLGHSKVETGTIDRYNAWRSQMVGIIDHPLFRKFLGKEAALAFYPIGDPAHPLDWAGYASGMILVTRTEVSAQVTDLLASIWSQGSNEWSVEQIRYKNSNITAVHFKKTGMTLYYAHVRDLLLVSTNQNLVASSIDVTKREHLPLSQDEDFHSVVMNFYNAPDGILYVNVPKVQEFVSQSLGLPVSGDAQAADQTADGLQGIKASGVSFDFGDPIKGKLTVQYDPAKLKPEVAAMYRCAPVKNSTLDFVPKSAILYQWVNCFDAPTYYQRLKVLQQERTKDLEPPFAALEETWGFDIEKDILPILDSETGWFMEEIDVKGLFPMPKLAVFIKIKDEKKAGDILRRIVTTPVTLVQQEDYQDFRIHFVSFPLFSFKPSYTFINGYLIMSSSDTLLKSAVDALKDPDQSLRRQSVFEDVAGRLPETGNVLSFADVGKFAGQARVLFDWTNKWFLLKIKQADVDENGLVKKLETLKTRVQDKEEDLKETLAKLEGLRQQERELQAAYDANAVSAEAKDTLAKPGAIIDPKTAVTGPTLEEVKFKKSQVTGLEMEIGGIHREIEDLKAQEPDLQDDIDNFEQQKKDAQEFRYYVDEVVVPLLQGLESFAGKLMHTTFKENAIETEVFLKTQ